MVFYYNPITFHLLKTGWVGGFPYTHPTNPTTFYTG